MIEICEECGQKYRLDASVRERHGARFQCKACGHLITIISHVPLNLEEQPVDVLATDLLPPTEDVRPESEVSTPRGGGLQTKVMGLFTRVQDGMGRSSKRPRR